VKSATIRCSGSSRSAAAAILLAQSAIPTMSLSRKRTRASSASALVSSTPWMRSTAEASSSAARGTDPVDSSSLPTVARACPRTMGCSVASSTAAVSALVRETDEFLGQCWVWAGTRLGPVPRAGQRVQFVGECFSEGGVGTSLLCRGGNRKRSRSGSGAEPNRWASFSRAEISSSASGFPAVSSASRAATCGLRRSARSWPASAGFRPWSTTIGRPCSRSADSAPAGPDQTNPTASSRSQRAAKAKAAVDSRSTHSRRRLARGRGCGRPRRRAATTWRRRPGRFGRRRRRGSQPRAAARACRCASGTSASRPRSAPSAWSSPA
jgi:hypothetical protein